MVSIRTKYHGPTNVRGSRVSATVDDHGPRRSITLSWDNSLGSQENHDFVARALIRRLGWDLQTGHWYRGGTAAGYVYVKAVDGERVDV